MPRKAGTGMILGHPITPPSHWIHHNQKKNARFLLQEDIPFLNTFGTFMAGILLII